MADKKIDMNLSYTDFFFSYDALIYTWILQSSIKFTFFIFTFHLFGVMNLQMQNS